MADLPKPVFVLFKVRRMIKKIIQMWHLNFLSADSNAAVVRRFD